MRYFYINLLVLVSLGKISKLRMAKKKKKIITQAVKVVLVNSVAIPTHVIMNSWISKNSSNEAKKKFYIYIGMIIARITSSPSLIGIASLLKKNNGSISM